MVRESKDSEKKVLGVNGATIYFPFKDQLIKI